MSSHDLQQSAAELLEKTTADQHRASDPRASAWVAANAGAGKTHVLKMRVLRLLLDGVAPERILCLTYTKAAAAEMAERVFKELSSWSTMPPPALDKELETLLGHVPDDVERRDARQLFARAIETPGGLKVQTIHAFCERLLQRFPLEANVPPGFTILDDATAAAMLREAVDDALGRATADPAGEMAAAVRCAIAFAADDQFDNVLGEALSRRDWISALARMSGGGEGADGCELPDAMARVRSMYLSAFDLDQSDTDDALSEALARVLSDSQLDAAVTALSGGSTNDQKRADAVRGACQATARDTRVLALTTVFLTSDKPRSDKTFITKKTRETEPGVADMMYATKETFAALYDKRRRRRVVDATIALLTIADQVMAHFTRAKSHRAALDFDDLIARAASLLDQSNAAAWVLYKLDGGLDHVLVDEAQDTSPVQWRVVEQLVSEFYAGAGARAELAANDEESRPRSVFAVGDEKQSIYSFQGAAPKMFAEAGATFHERAVAAEQAFERVPLMLSFRTVAPLLQVVDRIFADAERTPGLSATVDSIEHLALRRGEAGLFELWETEKPEELASVPAFTPLVEEAQPSPITRLATRIATKIDGWLTSGEQLVSENRPVRPGDILILVRKRHPFASEMVRQLKLRGVPVAGADRIVLGDHIAVQDLMALADFLLLPEDDLALANVLKSPLFGFDDDDLFALAADRPGLLWTALLDAAKTRARFAPAADALKRWRAQADFSPPFEFFANLLDRDGARARLLARLGAEAGDALDEFINLALNYDEQAPPSLQGFVTWMRAGRREIKRDMDAGRDVVRVMTVHGSKGLEAPIVFLPDTCSAPGAGRPGALVELEAGTVSPGLHEVFAWAVKGASKAAQVEAARQTEQAERLAEHNRLLYVAMTRARDRVYVGGYEGKTGIAKGSWYATIDEGLGGLLQAAHDEAGGRVRRIEAVQSIALTSQTEAASSSAPAPAALPAWARTPAPSEPVLTVPLAPSRIADAQAAAMMSEDGEWPALSDQRDAYVPPLEPASPSPLFLARDDRLLRGTITHALLEHLPTIDATRWPEVAAEFVRARGADLPGAVHDGIVNEALQILGDTSFGDAFGPTSRAEVSIVAEVPNPDGEGPRLRINGQIDRLVVRGDDILIVDYKSNRRPPARPEHVSEAYLLQLAAYRIAVQQVYPGRNIEAALLWTDGPSLMPVPGELLDQVAPRLWDMAS